MDQPNLIAFAESGAPPSDKKTSRTAAAMAAQAPLSGVHARTILGGNLGAQVAEEPENSTLSRPTMPYLTDGVLVIPEAAPDRFKWWKKGAISIEQTLRELGASEEVLRSYVPPAPEG